MVTTGGRFGCWHPLMLSWPATVVLTCDGYASRAVDFRTLPVVSFTDATIARLPRPIRPYFERHHELIKFAIVGATTFVIDSAVFFTLKLTVLEPKPVTAKIIAGIVAVIASYILNREWSFRDRGGRERHHEALLFFGFSGVGVLICMAPLWFSSYVLMLRVPEVSLTVENIADFIAAYIIGNLLQMGFRFWAFRRWVFPDEFGRSPDKAVESTFTPAVSPRRWRTCTKRTKLATSRRCGASPSAGRGRLPDDRLSDPPSPTCRRLRDTAVSAPAPLGECR